MLSGRALYRSSAGLLRPATGESQTHTVIHTHIQTEQCLRCNAASPPGAEHAILTNSSVKSTLQTSLINLGSVSQCLCNDSLSLSDDTYLRFNKVHLMRSHSSS